MGGRPPPGGLARGRHAIGSGGLGRVRVVQAGHARAARDALCFRVWGLGFGGQGLGFRV